MNTGTVNKLLYLSQHISLRFMPVLRTCRPACAAPGDYGFDFDAIELESELLSPQFNRQSSQFIQPVEASEFEMRYRWFIS